MLCLGIDYGGKYTGLAVVDTRNNKVLYAKTVKMRSDIPDKYLQRRALRSMRRGQTGADQAVYYLRRCLTMTERIRSSIDRRSGTDRRKAYRLGFFLKGGVEKRTGKERRSNDERRRGWVRVGKWSGVQLSSLKIAKFLK